MTLSNCVRNLTAVIIAGVLLLAGCASKAEFIEGVDLSILKTAEDHGVQYRLDGKPTDAMQIFRKNGCNYVRLRLFVDPPGIDGQVNTLGYTIALAKRAKLAGFSLLLDFHYCDTWADANSQPIPAKWMVLNREQLVCKVHDYTASVLAAFARSDCMPDMVAIGNEITDGMLWPDGGPLEDQPQKWPPLLDLLRAGISAVRETAPASRIKIMIHLDRGGDEKVVDPFFARCQKEHLDFDVIGLSYYPFWLVTLDNLKHNLDSLSSKYGKDIVIAETSYNYTGDQGSLPFPATPDGQKQFLDRLIAVVAGTRGGHGVGVIYWEPAWIQGKKWNGPDWSEKWEQRALFDDEGNALPAMGAFKVAPF